MTTKVIGFVRPPTVAPVFNGSCVGGHMCTFVLEVCIGHIHVIVDDKVEKTFSELNSFNAFNANLTALEYNTSSPRFSRHLPEVSAALFTFLTIKLYSLLPLTIQYQISPA